MPGIKVIRLLVGRGEIPRPYSYAVGDTVEYAYDDLNRKTGMTDKNGVSEYEYDDMSRLTKVSDAAEEEVSYEYDSKGRESKIIYPDGKFVTYGYDEHDRLETVTDREGRVTSYTYDDAGRSKTTKYPNGITTTYTYDKSNRIVEIDNVSSSGSTVEKLSYGYDGAGNKIREEITKEDKHYLREYTYYKNNTVKSMAESGDNNTEYIYQYDAAGNILEKVVKEGEVSKEYNYIYNEANRMTEEQVDEVTTRLYRYDANGNRTAVVISAGVIAEEATVEGEIAVAEEKVTAETTSKGKGKGKSGAAVESEEEVVEANKEEADYYYYDDADRLVEIVEHNGKQFTYGYDGDGNRLWRTYSQTPVIKPIPEKGENGNGKENAPGQNKDKGNGNGNGKNTGSIDADTLEFASASLSQMFLAAAEKSNNGNGNGNGNSGNDNGNSDNGNGNSGNDNGNSDSGNGNSGNDKGNSDNGNGNSSNNGNSNDKDNSNSSGNGKDKDNGNGNNGKGNDKVKDNKGKHLGWYKRLTHPKNPDGIAITEPEVFEVTNYINDINRENAEVLMTSDVDGNYWGVYTYGIDRISAEDLVSIEGKPNNPLYYLQDALGTTTSVTNMNAGVIDSNRFAPYGEPLDPVAKNSRRTNSSFGFTGEAHGIEEGLVYLRARYYEPDTMRFLQQDTMFGDIKEPMSRNLYIYGNANPLTYVDPSGHMSYTKQFDDLLSGVWGGVKDNITGIKNAPGMIISLARALMSKNINVATLVESGLQGMVEDYVYIYSNRSVLYPSTTVTDTQVYEMGKHLSGTIVDIALALTGAGAVKVIKMLEKTGGVGKKLVKAFKSGKADDVLDEAVDEGAILAREATDADAPITKGNGKTPQVTGEARKFWTNATKHNGVKVYQRNDIIDPNKVDSFGRTNLQRMKQGLAPVGPDGKSVNLHHMTQRNESAIAEVTQSFHQQNSKVIHINPNTIPSGIDRNAFNAWKSSYWMSRANDFK